MISTDILEQNQINVEKHWNHYYSDANLPSQIPSSFAKFCRDHFIKDSDVVFDFGCGDGRDTQYFSQQGLKVYACDISEEAIALTKKRVGNNTNTIFRSDVTRLSDTKINLDFNVAYCRFFLHSLTHEQEAVFLNWLSEKLSSDGKLLIEARTTNDLLCNDNYRKIDTNTYLYEDNHFRRFIVPEQLIKTITAHGFELIYQKTSNQFSSVNKNGKLDNPELLRAAFKKNNAKVACPAKSK